MRRRHPRSAQPPLSALFLVVPPDLNDRLFAVCAAYADLEERHTGVRAAPEPCVLARYLLELSLAGEARAVAGHLYQDRNSRPRPALPADSNPPGGLRITR